MYGHSFFLSSYIQRKKSCRSRRFFCFYDQHVWVCVRLTSFIISLKKGVGCAWNLSFEYKLINLILQTRCLSYHLTSWRKSVLNQNPSVQRKPKTFNQHSTAEMTKSDLSRVFLADRYIHWTHKSAAIVGAKGKKFIVKFSRFFKNALPDPICS